MLSGGAARAVSPLLVATEVRADRVEMDSLVCELRGAANEGCHLLSEGMLSIQGPQCSGALVSSSAHAQSPITEKVQTGRSGRGSIPRRRHDLMRAARSSRPFNPASYRSERCRSIESRDFSETPRCLTLLRSS